MSVQEYSNYSPPKLNFAKAGAHLYTDGLYTDYWVSGDRKNLKSQEIYGNLEKSENFASSVQQKSA